MSWCYWCICKFLDFSFFVLRFCVILNFIFFVIFSITVVISFSRGSLLTYYCYFLDIIVIVIVVVIL